MNEKCPECNSEHLHFEGSIDDPVMEFDDGKLMALKIEDQSSAEFDISCGSCGAKLRATKDGLRTITM